MPRVNLDHIEWDLVKGKGREGRRPVLDATGEFHKLATKSWKSTTLEKLQGFGDQHGDLVFTCAVTLDMPEWEAG